MPDLDQVEGGVAAGDQETGDSTAAAESPLTLEAIVAALEPVLTKRLSGITTLIDKRVSPLAQQLDDLKTAAMSDDEREQFVQGRDTADRTKLERENTLLKMQLESDSRRDAVKLFQTLDEAETLEDQLAIIEAVLGKRVADKVEDKVVEATDETSVADVNTNNPSRTKTVSLAGFDGTADSLTEEMADRILASAGKGALISGR